MLLTISFIIINYSFLFITGGKMFFELLIALIVISAVSLAGALVLSLKRKNLDNFLELMVAFAVGALLGDVFIHLLPQLSESGFSVWISLTVLLGIVVFFILEKLVHWHHCHRFAHSAEHKHHSFGHIALAGDALHNFIDGLILAGAFVASPALGVATAIAIILHEVPQEIADFGVLLKSGFSRKKALFYNFLISLTAFVGAGVGLLISSFEVFIPFLIAFTAGGFLYLAGTDLLPELHKKFSTKQSVLQLAWIIIGIAVMALLLLLE